MNDFYTGFLLCAAISLAGCASAPSAPPPGQAPKREASALTLQREAIDHPSERVAAAGAAPRWIGVELRPAPAGAAGVLVHAVFPGSPAERAGVLDGDVLLVLAGRAVNSADDVTEVVRAAALGAPLPVQLRRAETERLLRVVVEPMPTRDELVHQSYVGRPAPSFEGLVPVQRGASAELGALRGRVVVVEFWASWCAVCRFMTPILNDWQTRYASKGAVVLGITTDSAAQAEMAADSFDIEYPLFSDPTGKTTLAYRATSIPTVFLIEPSGVVQDVMIGFSSRDIAGMQRRLEALLAEP